MKLVEMTIRNLRAIESLELCLSDFTSLIGPNNTGKTTVLRAIEILLNQEKPDVTEWRHGHEGDPIEIVGRFTDIQDWERDTPGVSGLLHNGEIQLRATATQDDESVSLDYDAYTRPALVDGWSSKWSELSDEIKAVAGKLGIDGRAWRTGANQERVRETLSSAHPDLVEYGDPEWKLTCAV